MGKQSKGKNTKDPRLSHLDTNVHVASANDMTGRIPATKPDK